MNLLAQYISPALTHAIGETLMHSIWQLTALAGLLLLTLTLVPARASRLRYRLATLTLTAMLIAPAVTFVKVYEPAQTTIHSSIPAEISVAPVALVQFENAQPGVWNTIQSFFLNHSELITGLYALGVFFLVLRFMVGYWKIRDLRHRGTEPAPYEVEERFNRLIARLGIRRKVELLQSRLVDSPMIIGTLKPLVLFPVGMLTGMNPDQIDCILVHELAHVRRWDYLANIMQGLVEIILFFHPATWWVSKLMREERENACDQLVIEFTEKPTVYAHALLNLEVRRQEDPRMALSARGGKLLTRIQRITGGEVRRERPYSRGLVLGVITLMLMVLFTTTTNREVHASQPPHDSLPPEIQYVDDQTGEFNQDRLDPIVSNRVTEISYVETDSPNTKIVIIENGQKVEINYDDQGRIASVYRNGEAVPRSEYGQYEEIAQMAMAKRPARIPLPPAPANGNSMPMPPMPNMGNMPPMPAMPPMPDMSNMPKPPVPPSDRADEKAWERYEDAMEDYEDAMEEWAENYEDQVENDGRWDRYEDAMEEWGENFEREFENSEEWEEFGRRMEAWGEEFGREMEKLGAHIEMEIEEQDWEGFGKRMEEMGRRIEIRINEQDWEEFGEQVGVMAEELAEEMEELAEELEEEMEELAEDRQEREREREEERVERIRIRNNFSMDNLRDELDRDGLVDQGDGFRLKINEDELFINGDRQADSVHRKYKRMLERQFDMDIDEEDVQINYRKGSTKIKK